MSHSPRHHIVHIFIVVSLMLVLLAVAFVVFVTPESEEADDLPTTYPTQSVQWRQFSFDYPTTWSAIRDVMLSSTQQTNVSEQEGLIFSPGAPIISDDSIIIGGLSGVCDVEAFTGNRCVVVKGLPMYTRSDDPVVHIVFENLHEQLQEQLRAS